MGQARSDHAYEIYESWARLHHVIGQKYPHQLFTVERPRISWMSSNSTARNERNIPNSKSEGFTLQ